MCINVNCVLQYELLAKLINDYIPETDLADIFFSNINNNTASELNGYNPSYFLFYCENLKKIKFMTKHLDNTSELQNVINIFCEKLKLGNELLPQVKVKNSNHNMTDLRGLSHCRLIELSTSDSEQIDVKKLGDGEISYSYLVDYRSDIMKIFTSEGFNYSKYSNLNQMYQHYSLSLASIIDEKSQIKDVNLENNYDFLLKIIDKWQKFDKESRLFELFENSSNLTKDLFKYTHMQIENYNKTFDDVLSAVVKTLKNLKTEYATIDTLLDKDLKNFLQFIFLELGFMVE